MHAVLADQGSLGRTGRRELAWAQRVARPAAVVRRKQALLVSKYHTMLVIMASVSDTLRRAIENAPETRYQIAKATGIAESTLSRFVVGNRPLSGQSIDTLAEYLGLELKPKRPAGVRKGRRN